MIYFHLLTTPMSTQFGLFKGTIAGLAAEKRWPEERYRESFEESLRRGFVKYDEKHQLIWLVCYFDHNKPHNPNIIRSWGEEYQELPDCSLKDEFYQFFDSYLKEPREGFKESFRESFRESFIKKHDLVTASANAYAKEGGAGGEQKPSSSVPVKRTPEDVAQVKSESAYREFRIVIDKHLQGGARIAIENKVSIAVFRELGGIDEIRKLIAQNGTALEHAFRSRYEQRDMAEYAKNRSG